MDVFVIPIGPDRYELYCETVEMPIDESPPSDSFFGRLRHRFTVMLRAAEERRQSGQTTEAATWWGRVQERLLAWVAERIAEQRLLWNLRRQPEAMLAHPDDMTAEQMLTLVRRMLQRDYERHRLWLVIDSILLVISGLLALVPGPNLVAYYFAFRVVGHWLSMRGAAQGVHRVTWKAVSSPALTELRRLVAIPDHVRAPQVRAIEAQLRLQHLATFFDRVAVPR